jgi:predicted lipid carrier protein YhbT
MPAAAGASNRYRASNCLRQRKDATAMRPPACAPVQRQLAIAALELSLRLAPSIAMQPLLDALAAMMARRHERVFERLAPWAGTSFLIAPSGLPRGFLLRVPAAQHPPRLRIVDLGHAPAADAVLRGPLALLCDLLEGRLDGDAAFFERLLRVEGDTGAILALRNATDGEEIDLVSDVIASLPPLLRPAAMMADALGRRIGAALAIRVSPPQG